MDPNANQQNQTLLDEQLSETRQLSNQIKQRITQLEQQPAAGGDVRMQKNQVRPNSARCLLPQIYTQSPIDITHSQEVCRGIAKLPEG